MTTSSSKSRKKKRVKSGVKPRGKNTRQRRNKNSHIRNKNTHRKRKRGVYRKKRLTHRNKHKKTHNNKETNCKSCFVYKGDLKQKGGSTTASTTASVSPDTITVKLVTPSAHNSIEQSVTSTELVTSSGKEQLIINLLHNYCDVLKNYKNKNTKMVEWTQNDFTYDQQQPIPTYNFIQKIQKIYNLNDFGNNVDEFNLKMTIERSLLKNKPFEQLKQNENIITVADMTNIFGLSESLGKTILKGRGKEEEAATKEQKDNIIGDLNTLKVSAEVEETYIIQQIHSSGDPPPIELMSLHGLSYKRINQIKETKNHIDQIFSSFDVSNQTLNNIFNYYVDEIKKDTQPIASAPPTASEMTHAPQARNWTKITHAPQARNWTKIGQMDLDIQSNYDTFIGGLTLQNTKGDGNCGYHGLIHGLFETYMVFYKYDSSHNTHKNEKLSQLMNVLFTPGNVYDQIQTILNKCVQNNQIEISREVINKFRKYLIELKRTPEKYSDEILARKYDGHKNEDIIKYIQDRIILTKKRTSTPITGHGGKFIRNEWKEEEQKTPSVEKQRKYVVEFMTDIDHNKSNYENVYVFQKAENVYQYQCNKTMVNGIEKYTVTKLTDEVFKRMQNENTEERNKIWPDLEEEQEKLNSHKGVRSKYWLHERIISKACEYFNVHSIQISIDENGGGKLNVHGVDDGKNAISPIFMSTGGYHFSKRLPTIEFIKKYSVEIS